MRETIHTLRRWSATIDRRWSRACSKQWWFLGRNVFFIVSWLDIRAAYGRLGKIVKIMHFQDALLQILCYIKYYINYKY